MTHAAARGSLEAAEHFDTIHDPGASGEEIAASLFWLEQDVAREAELRRIARFLAACDEVRNSIDPSELGARIGRIESSWRSTVRKVVLPIAASIAAVLVVTLTTLFLQGHPGSPSAEVTKFPSFATGVGEVRQVQLTDGSTVTLGGVTSFVARLSAHSREIELRDGEAYFEVAHDPLRPFVVTTEAGSVRAVGTAFEVGTQLGRTSVGVSHGKVRVTTIFGKAADLGIGRSLTFRFDGSMSEPVAVDPDHIGTWRRGTMIFESEPLDQVVAKLNRYSDRRIVIATYGLGSRSISGIVKLDRISEWLLSLRFAGDIEVRDGPDGSIQLSSSEKPPAIVAR